MKLTNLNKAQLLSAAQQLQQENEQLKDVTAILTYLLSQAMSVCVAFLRACLDEDRITQTLKQVTYTAVKAGVFVYLLGITTKEKLDTFSIPEITIPNLQF